MILPYLAKWYVNAKFFGKHRPLQTVLFISDECNLRCKHCYVYSREKPVVKSYEQIRDDLQYSYNLGSRFVDFEGGEPMIWHDGEKNINDLIALAKEIGFFSTTITTNAQLPLNECKAHSIWVSMDGVGEYHEMIRGKGTWAKLEKNIAEARAQEIDQLQQRIQNFREMAAKDLQTQQQAKVAPIIEKINKAIQAVGEKEGFTYIYDISQGNILYFNPTQCIDVLPLVKKELGLQ